MFITLRLQLLYLVLRQFIGINLLFFSFLCLANKKLANTSIEYIVHAVFTCIAHSYPMLFFASVLMISRLATAEFCELHFIYKMPMYKRYMHVWKDNC